MPGSSVPVRVPTLGESVVEATVGAWLKQEGQPVQAGETLVQLETEKVNVEVAAERSGVLGRIERQEGATVQPGEVLATLEDATVAAAPAQTQTQPDTEPLAAPSPNGGPTAAVDAAPATAKAKAETPEGEGDVDRPHASPVARRMAEEHGLDLGQVPGTGTGGRVTREDVERAIAQDAQGSETPARPAPPAQPRPPSVPAASLPPGLGGDGGGDRNRNSGREQRVRMSRRRQTIAQRLLEAQRTAAMLTTFNEVDMTAAMAMRSEYKDAFEKRHKGVRLGFMSFFVRACVAALQEFPAVNAEIDGNEIIYKHFVHMGIAVGGANGLVVPVVRDADGLGFAGIEKAIGDFGRRARDGALKVDELSGGTFTITNGGVYGSLMSTPILNAPQSGILGMHKIQDRPMAIGGKVEIRPMMYLALSYDHRIVDGKEAVSFLVRVKEGVEDPRRLLLDL